MIPKQILTTQQYLHAVFTLVFSIAYLFKTLPQFRNYSYDVGAFLNREKSAEERARSGATTYKSYKYLFRAGIEPTTCSAAVDRWTTKPVLLLISCCSKKAWQLSFLRDLVKFRFVGAFLMVAIVGSGFQELQRFKNGVAGLLKNCTSYVQGQVCLDTGFRGYRHDVILIILKMRKYTSKRPKASL